MNSGCPIGYSSHDLPQCLCADITNGEYTGDVGAGTLICDNVSSQINRNLIFHQFGGRFSSDADKHTVASKRAFLSGFHIPSPDTGQLFVMEQCDDLIVPEEFYIFRFHQRLMVDLCCF